MKIVCCPNRGSPLRDRTENGRRGALQTLSWQRPSSVAPQDGRKTWWWKAKAQLERWSATIQQICGLRQTILGYAQRIPVYVRQTSTKGQHCETSHWANARKEPIKSARYRTGPKAREFEKAKNEENAVQMGHWTCADRLDCPDSIFALQKKMDLSNYV